MDRMPNSVKDVEQRVGGSGFVKPEQPASNGNGGNSQQIQKPVTHAPGRQMKKRVIPDLIKFDAPGVNCSGVLVRMNLKKGDTKNYMEYILHNVEEGKIHRFNGSYEIDNQIFRTDLGKFIEVTFTGEDRNIVRNGNALKKFEVFVEEGKPGNPAPSVEWQATDEDIPF